MTVAHRIRLALAALLLAVVGGTLVPARGEDQAQPESIRFRVVDTDGEPVPAARVWLIGGRFGYGVSWLESATQSDTDGYVDVPKPLLYSVGLLAVEGTRLGWLGWPVDGRNLVLAPATDTVQGRIVPLPDTPSTNLRVRVCSLMRPTGGVPGGRIAIPAEVGLLASAPDPDGTFAIHGVPGDAHVELATDHAEAAEVVWNFAPARRGEPLVELPAQQVQVTVRDRLRNPLEGLWVEVTPCMPWQKGGVYFPHFLARTDRQGRVLFSRLHRGHRYQFAVRHEGWYSHPGEVPVGDRSLLPLVELVADHGGRVEGEITRVGEGDPITSGYLVFTAEGRPQDYNFSRISAPVQRDGSFVKTLPAGTYVLSWPDPRGEFESLHYEPGTRVTVQEGQTTSVAVTITPDTPVRKIYARP